MHVELYYFPTVSFNTISIVISNSAFVSARGVQRAHPGKTSTAVPQHTYDRWSVMLAKSLRVPGSSHIAFPSRQLHENQDRENLVQTLVPSPVTV